MSYWIEVTNMKSLFRFHLVKEGISVMQWMNYRNKMSKIFLVPIYFEIICLNPYGRSWRISLAFSLINQRKWNLRNKIFWRTKCSIVEYNKHFRGSPKGTLEAHYLKKVFSFVYKTDKQRYKHELCRCFIESLFVSKARQANWNRVYNISLSFDTQPSWMPNWLFSLEMNKSKRFKV